MILQKFWKKKMRVRQISLESLFNFSIRDELGEFYQNSMNQIELYILAQIKQN